MMKSKLNIVFVLFLTFTLGFAQTKQEREFRIDKEDFPTQSLKVLLPYIKEVKKVRHYKETDGQKISYEAKFKKDKLRYSVEFDSLGNLEDVEFIIKKNDIPSGSFINLQNYLKNKHKKVKVKKIQQQYLAVGTEPKKVLKEAFQNLLLPSIRYEIVISSKEEKGYQYYEVTFDHQGNHLSSRKFSDSNYDHVLY